MTIYKQDLALNNLLGLICHKTQPNQPKHLDVRESLSLYSYISIFM